MIRHTGINVKNNKQNYFSFFNIQHFITGFDVWIKSSHNKMMRLDGFEYTKHAVGKKELQWHI